MATLLIVEDDHKTNDAICEYLRPTGHTLIPACDGVEEGRQRQQRQTVQAPPVRRPDIQEIAVAHVTDKYSEYYTNGNGDDDPDTVPSPA